MKNQPTPFTRPKAVSPENTEDRIRQRAYELYEQRGREDGHDLDDWLTAEAEVNQNTRVAAA